MLVTKDNLRKCIVENLTKNEVYSMINSKLDSKLNSREFKKLVKELSADVVNEVFKILWQRNSFWKSASINV